jgi:hypothetical protein
MTILPSLSAQGSSFVWSLQSDFVKLGGSYLINMTRFHFSIFRTELLFRFNFKLCKLL